MVSYERAAWIDRPGRDRPLAVATLVKYSESAALARLVLDLTPRRQRGSWALQLDEAVAEAPGGLVMVAYGLACAALAFWAQLTPVQYLGSIRGALLIGPTWPAGNRAFSFQKMPRTRLPFPSLILNGRPDGHDATERQLAGRWGSELVDRGNLDHRNWSWLPGCAQLPIIAVSE